MPTVAELDVQIDATNRASDELAKVDAQIKRLDGQDVDVDVEASGVERARRELVQVVREAEAADGKQVKITIETLLKEAQRDLKKFRDTVEASQANIKVVVDRDELSQDLRGLREEIERQKVTLRVEADTIAAQVKLEALDRLADNLDARIKADIDDAVAATKLAVLERAINALDANIDIDMDTAAIHAKVTALRNQIEEATRTREAKVKLIADTVAAQLRITQLDEFADSIEGKIKMGVDDAVVRAKIAALKAAIATLDKNIELDSDTSGLHTKLNALQAHFTALDEAAREAGRGINKGGGDGGKGLDQLSLAAERAGGNVRGLIAAGLALWPALIPMAGAATAAVGGFGLATITAGIGTGLFAAVATTNYNDITESINKIETAQRAADVAITDTAKENALKRVAAEYENLTESQAGAVRELMAFKSEWRDFAQQFEPQVFGIAANGLNLMREIFPQLGPMVEGVGTAFDNLINKARGALAGPFWQDFIRMLNEDAGPAVETLFTGLGNLFEGLMGMFSAFAPFQDDWNAGFIRMTERFKEWGTTLGESQGFKDFMTYARDAIPRVNDFLGSLLDALVAIVRAVAPYGDIVLSALTAFLDVITFIGREAPALLAVSVALIGITAGFIAMLGPITSVLNVIRLLFLAFGGRGGAVANFVMIAAGIGAGLAVIGGAAIYAYTQFEGFRIVVNGAMREATALIGAFATWLVTIMTNIADALLPPADSIRALAESIGLILLGALSFLAQALGAILVPIGNFILAISENDGAVRGIAATITLLLLPTFARMAAAAVVTAASWVAMAAVAVVQAAITVGAWVLAQAAAIAGAVITVARLVLMSLAWSAHAAVAVVQAAIIVGAWVLTQGGALAALAVMIATTAGFVASWVAAAAGAVASALVIAGAWLIALGPIGLLLAGIGLVIAIASAVYVAWQGMPEWFFQLWEAIKAPFQAFFTWVGEKLGTFASVFKIEGASALQGFGAGATANLPVGMDPINQIPTQANGTLQNGVWMRPQGLGAMSMFGAGGLEGQPNALAPFLGLPGLIAPAVEPGLQNMSISGRDHMAAFGSASDAAKPTALDPFAGLPPELKAAIGDPAAIMNPGGKATMEGFGTGANAGKTAALAPLVALPGESVAAVGATEGLLTDQGRRLMEGYARGIDSAQPTVAASMESIKTLVNNAITAHITHVDSQMTALSAAITNGINAALGILGGFVNSAVGVLNGMQGRFYNAGSAAGADLASGLRSQAGAVNAAANELARAAARQMPGSPAEEGPLSGQGYALIRGQHLAEDFARGMRQKAGAIQATARDMADLATLATRPELAFNQIAAGSTRNTVTLAPGAVTLTVQVGEGVSVEAARSAFDGAGEDLAEKLALALRRE